MDRYDFLYEKYRVYMSKVISDGLVAKEEFKIRFASELEEMHIIELISSCVGEGFLHYALWTDEVTHCFVPVYGYYAENEKTMVRLFQKLADTVVRNCVCDFSINLYSGDTECITALHMDSLKNFSSLLSREPYQRDTDICGLNMALQIPTPEVFGINTSRLINMN